MAAAGIHCSILMNTQVPMDGDHASPTETSLQGTVASLASAIERRAALDQAFDYRGDVTLTLTDGRTVEGFVFDRVAAGDDPFIRLLPKETNQRQRIRYAEIASLAFTGKDAAHGKSWEAWVKKYQQKKAKGEKASLEAEPLE